MSRTPIVDRIPGDTLLVRAANACHGTGLKVKVAVGANVVVPRSVVCPECTRRLRATTSPVRDGRKWFHRVPVHRAAATGGELR